jgi:hypothetical protein
LWVKERACQHHDAKKAAAADYLQGRFKAQKPPQEWTITHELRF